MVKVISDEMTGSEASGFCGCVGIWQCSVSWSWMFKQWLDVCSAQLSSADRPIRFQLIVAAASRSCVKLQIKTGNTDNLLKKIKVAATGTLLDIFTWKTTLIKIDYCVYLQGNKQSAFCYGLLLYNFLFLI